jgi:hypothetical protein
MIDYQQLREDGLFGLSSETRLLNTFSKFFKCKLKLTKYRNSLFDYESADESKVKIELKTRRCCKDAYPTTILGVNKCSEGLKLIEEGYDIYFAFKFEDGLYYYQLTNNSPSEYTVGNITSHRRGLCESKTHAFIPTTLLTKIEP